MSIISFAAKGNPKFFLFVKSNFFAISIEFSKSIKEKALIVFSLVLILFKQLSTHSSRESLFALISSKALVAVNSNDILDRFFRNNDYSKEKVNGSNPLMLKFSTWVFQNFHKY